MPATTYRTVRQLSQENNAVCQKLAECLTDLNTLGLSLTNVARVLDRVVLTLPDPFPEVEAGQTPWPEHYELELVL